MHRFTRWLLNALTALSLLTCATTAALWARSPRVCDRVDAITPRRYFAAMTYPNGVEWLTFPQPQDRPRPLHFSSAAYNVKNAFGAWIVPKAAPHPTLGFAMPPLRFSNRPAPEPRSLDLFTPFWFLVLAQWMLPAALLARRLRSSRRRRAGRCPDCDYDLTGNTSGVCPECGTATPRPPAITSH